MTLAATAGIAVIVLYAILAPILCRRLTPAVATRVVVVGNLGAAASGGFILAVLAFTWIGQFPAVAAQGPWSPNALHSDSPVPAAPAVASAVLVTLAATSAALTGGRRLKALLVVRRACRELNSVDGLVVLDDARPEAFSTPQPAGRIVVTSGLLRALGAAERRVLLAHERSHLAHRHAWWILAADLAAAVNPMLRPATRAATTAVERWADEDAACAVGDRRLVALTLVRVAQLRARFTSPLPASGPGATDGDIAVRVRALLEPPPRRRPLATAAVIAVLLAITVPAVAVQHTGEALFEHAARTTAVHQS